MDTSSLPFDKLEHSVFSQYLSQRKDRDYNYNCSGWYLKGSPISIFGDQRVREFTTYNEPLLLSKIITLCKRFQTAVMSELLEYCYVGIIRILLC